MASWHSCDNASGHYQRRPGSRFCSDHSQDRVLDGVDQAPLLLLGEGHGRRPAVRSLQFNVSKFV